MDNKEKFINDLVETKVSEMLDIIRDKYEHDETIEMELKLWGRVIERAAEILRGNAEILLGNFDVIMPKP